MKQRNPDPTSKDCQGSLDPEAIKGLYLFNQGQYWLAHEALEAAWLAEPGQIRHLYRGILQVGVVYYHISQQNYPGAVKVYNRCLRWLDPFPAICRGINLAQLRLDLNHVMEDVFRLGPDHIGNFDLSLLSPIEWVES